MYVIHCGTLVDGVREAPIDDGRVVAENGRVVDAGPADEVDVPEDAEPIDHSRETVIPGLIDAHLHLWGSRSMEPFDWLRESSELGTARATADLRTLLTAGFTTVRDVGSETGLALREAVDDGTIPGPRVFTSWRSLSQTGGHGDSHYLPYEWATGEAAGAGLADGPTSAGRRPASASEKASTSSKS
jgi:imidazolonepropionase-like amidohydrolase